MESDKNPFPRIEIINPIERIRRIGNAVLDYFSFPCISEESTRPRGAVEMLDAELYDNPAQGTLF